jgi:hypothetical protein
MITFKKAQELSPEEQLERFESFQRRIEERRILQSLKTQLSATDYKVIKCYEYNLVGEALPYDISLLHEEREAIREQIRELENS